MPSQTLPGRARLCDQGQHLDRQHREDTGHQIEDDAAEEREGRSLEYRQQRRALPRKGCLGDFDLGEFPSMPGPCGCGTFLDEEHAAGVRRRGGRKRAALQPQPQLAVLNAELLRRCVPHQRLRVGEEIGRAHGPGGQVLRIHRQRHPIPIELKKIRGLVEAAGCYGGHVEVEIFSQAWWSRPADELLDACVGRYQTVV